MNYVIAGLGNPGETYQNNRHNVGFLFIDFLVSALEIQNSKEKKFKGELYRFSSKSSKFYLFKPLEYMNNSGGPLQELLNFYKISESKLLVVYDDLDLKLADTRFRIGGGSGGHNGIKSIDDSFAHQYNKLKIGIDRPEHKNMVSSYVLSNFTKEELELIYNLFAKFLKNIDLLLEFDFEKLIMAVKNGI